MIFLNERLSQKGGRADGSRIGWSRVAVAASLVAALLLSASPAQAAPASGWGTAKPIDSFSSYSSGPRVALDPAGNAMAVWSQDGGGHLDIWANWMTVAEGWATPTLIETMDAGHAQAPQVGVDTNGNAIAVWFQSDGIRDSIWGNRYAVHTGWGQAVLLETNDSGPASSPRLAVAANGNAVVVWHQEYGGRYSAWANWFINGSGWQTAILIETNDLKDALFPQVAVDAGGNATAVWIQDNGSTAKLWANRGSVGSSWGTAAIIDDDDNASASNPQLATGAGGDTFVAWEKTGGGVYNIVASRYAAGIGWGSATPVETGSGHALAPQIAVDGSGNAVAMWEQSDGARYNLWANRFINGSGWQSGTLVETDNAGNAFAPQMASSMNGQVMGVWYQYDGAVNNIWANRFVPGSGWATAQLIETDNAGGALYPQVAIDPQGNAVAVWSQSVGSRVNVWANRFAAPDTTAPPMALSTPSSDISTNLSSVWVTGSTEVGASVSVNGYAASVAANGSFGLLLPLQLGLNLITATARDLAGNSASASVNVTYASATQALEQQVAALEAQLNLTNSSLWAALAGQNATWLAQLASQNTTLMALIGATNASLLNELALLNASLLAQLAAQNASLIGMIAQTNASLLAQLAAQDVALTQLISDTNASLLASMAAQNIGLLNLIGQTNASLLAQLAALNSSLTVRIAQTNASLLAALAAQDASLLNQIAATNASLLAQLAALDGSLTGRIAATDASLLATIAALNASLLQQIASTNASIFVALATQNGALVGALSAQNASLLAAIAAQDASLVTLIANTNDATLASLAALNTSLLARIASTNASLLASLASQNDALLARISEGDPALVAQLASINSTLWARLTAENGALWAALNASRDQQRTTDTSQNSTVSTLQGNLDAARAQAASAQSAATLGMVVGLAGLAVGALGTVLAVRARRSSGAQPGRSTTPPREPPKNE